MTAPSLGGMLATRQGSLMLALLCAVCAAGVLIFALGRYKTTVSQPVPQATALVATGEIAKGTTGARIAAEKLYKPMPVTASQLSPGAISNAAQIASQTASAAILPGQQLTTSDFSTLAAASLALDNGQRGLEINASGAQGAVDITNPNSRVDLWTIPKGGTTYFLAASDIKVLKPATATPVTLGNQPVPGSTLVLAVPNGLVSKLINAASIYVALRPGLSGAATPPAPSTTPTPPTTTTSNGAGG